MTHIPVQNWTETTDHLCPEKKKLIGMGLKAKSKRGAELPPIQEH